MTVKQTRQIDRLERLLSAECEAAGYTQDMLKAEVVAIRAGA